MKQKHYFVIEYEIDMDKPNNQGTWHWEGLSKSFYEAGFNWNGWFCKGLKLAAVEVDGDYKLLYKRD